MDKKYFWRNNVELFDKKLIECLIKKDNDEILNKLYEYSTFVKQSNGCNSDKLNELDNLATLYKILIPEKIDRFKALYEEKNQRELITTDSNLLTSMEFKKNFCNYREKLEKIVILHVDVHDHFSAFKNNILLLDSSSNRPTFLRSYEDLKINIDYNDLSKTPNVLMDIEKELDTLYEEYTFSKNSGDPYFYIKNGYAVEYIKVYHDYKNYLEDFKEKFSGLRKSISKFESLKNDIKYELFISRKELKSKFNLQDNNILMEAQDNFFNWLNK